MTIKQLARLIFHKDVAALIGALVFLWFTISLLSDNYYNFNNLSKHSGQLTKIDSVITKVKNKIFHKEIQKELRLTINTEKKYFTSFTTKNFGEITSQISIGDSVILFTKNKPWGIFGMKKASDISHLVKSDKAIIDFAKYKQSLTGAFLIPLIGCICLSILYYIRIRRRYFSEVSVNSK